MFILATQAELKFPFKGSKTEEVRPTRKLLFIFFDHCFVDKSVCQEFGLCSKFASLIDIDMPGSDFTSKLF